MNMKSKQNIIIVLLVILIVVLVVEGGAYIYFHGSAPSHPPVCAPGDAYNILTGKPCPSLSSAASTPSSAE